MGERWVILDLVEEETLRCHSSYIRAQKGKAHLYINVDDEVEDILCDLCWKKNQKEIKE